MAATPMGRILFVAVVAVLVPIVPFALVGELPGDKWLLAQDQSALRFGAAGAALLGLDMLLPIPSSIVGSLLGGRLGLAMGLVWTFGGLWLGHMAGYGLGRLWPARQVSDLTHAPNGGLIFLSRPVPVLAEAVALAAGAQRVPLVRFAFTCAAGDLVYAAALAANGATLLPQGLAGPGLIFPMLLPVLAWLAWRRWG